MRHITSHPRAVTEQEKKKWSPRTLRKRRFHAPKTMENTEDKSPVAKEKARNIICFFALGVLSLIYDEISLAAAEDVLSGSKIATTNVIIAIALPVLAVKISAPWFIQKCSYLYKSGIVVFLLVAGLIVIVSAESVRLRLFGISIIESGVSFSEITFLALTAAYEDVTVSAFVAGIGVASLLGPLYYTGNYYAVITILFPLHIHLILLVTVFDAILTSRQTREKLQYLYENLLPNNFRKTAVLKNI